MACWYWAAVKVPPEADISAGSPLIPSQQSSLRGTRTALICQLAIALTEAASLGPSNAPVAPADMQVYSEPERFTPSGRMTWFELLRIWLPETCRPLGEAACAAIGMWRVR